MSAATPLEERLIALELLVTHIERHLELLNSALLDQQKELDALKRSASRLDERITQLTEEDKPRNLTDERPPHY